MPLGAFIIFTWREENKTCEDDQGRGQEGGGGSPCCVCPRYSVCILASWRYILRTFLRRACMHTLARLGVCDLFNYPEVGLLTPHEHMRLDSRGWVNLGIFIPMHLSLCISTLRVFWGGGGGPGHAPRIPSPCHHPVANVGATALQVLRQPRRRRERRRRRSAIGFVPRR